MAATAGIALIERNARLLGRVRARDRALSGTRADMGRAPASKCVIGRRPRINSMVRSMDVVLYMVLSTMPRLRVGRNHERRRAVRIHVVRPVLRVVFQHEDRGAAARICSSKRPPPSCPARSRCRPSAESGAILPAAVPEV